MGTSLKNSNSCEACIAIVPGGKGTDFVIAAMAQAVIAKGGTNPSPALSTAFRYLETKEALNS
jgi:hypothetical protein